MLKGRKLKKMDQNTLNIGLIVTVFGTLVTIFGIFWPNIQSRLNNRLKITGDYYKLNNVVLKEVTNNFNDSIRTDVLKEKIASLNSDSRYDIYDYFSKNSAIDLLNDFHQMSSMWTYRFENIGKNEITDLIIDFPSDGYYKIDDSDNNSIKKFKGQIKLEPIRSGKKVGVTIWARKSVSWNNDPVMGKYDTESISITNTNGRFNIDYPVKVTGVLSWLGAKRYVGEAIKGIFVSMLVTSLIFFIVSKLKIK